jgi:hypothetical protein
MPRKPERSAPQKSRLRLAHILKKHVVLAVKRSQVPHYYSCIYTKKVLHRVIRPLTTRHTVPNDVVQVLKGFVHSVMLTTLKINIAIISNAE